MTSPFVDILAFAPHPDDAELFCGGLLISMADAGHRTAIVDLSRGELATGGSVEQRQQEIEAANSILELSVRENLRLPDGAIGETNEDAADSSTRPQLEAVVEVIRRLQPEIVLIPFSQGRHPDHSAASQLLQRALFFANVQKFAPEHGARFAPRQVLQYQMRYTFKPSFVANTSAAAERKAAAINCYQGQLIAPQSAPDKQTLLTATQSLSAIETRDRYYGSLIGATHGEPYFTPSTIALGDPLAHFRQNDTSKAQFFFGAGAK